MHKRCAGLVSPALLALLSLSTAVAQPVDANFDEGKVPKYTLPDPLILENGKRVTEARTWFEKRRPELLALVETEMYGHSPGKPPHMRVDAGPADPGALGGKAVRKLITLYFSGKDDGPKMNLLFYLPAGAKAPVPLFAGLNFSGNHTVANDPGVPLAEIWIREPGSRIPVRRLAGEDTRGSAASQWQVEKILARGYGLATAYYQDIEPDFNGGIEYGVRPLFFKPGQSSPAPDDWGAVAAWAWGLSRALDYFGTDPQIDSKRVAVMGHSRLGKAAIWAGARDDRFAMVISNDSGEGGAALARREYGERIHNLNQNPHWFCGNFKKYSHRDQELPFDQHEVLALIALRPLYVASAAEDLWADPRGEFLAAVAAGPVFELLGKRGLGVDQMPAIHHPIMHDIGYHIRAGKHDVTEYDWDQYLHFADMHLRNRSKF